MSSHDRSPARLVLQRPDGEELVYALDHGRSITLGRDDGNTIVLASQFVSKRHALVSWTPRGVRIEDQDSANGLTVNGLTVHAAQLSSGDVIQIGDQRLVFEIEGQASLPCPRRRCRAPGGGNKGLRLILAAVLTMLVMVGGLAGLYVMFLAPETSRPCRRACRPARIRRCRPTRRSRAFDSPQAQAIEQQALAATDKPVDWLFDEGQLAYKNGRLLDAYRSPARGAAARPAARVLASPAAAGDGRA